LLKNSPANLQFIIIAESMQVMDGCSVTVIAGSLNGW
jgi:hypothetical protein